jgi:outer membrane lipase/esterase
MPRLSSAVMLVMVFTVVTPTWAQTPAPDPLVQAAATPPQFGASVVIAPPGGLCRELVTQFATVGGPRGDLRDRCRELVADAKNPSLTVPVQNGLEQMAGVQITGAGNARVGTAGFQLSNISSRLAALRGGAFGVSLVGIDPDKDEPLPGTMLASLGSTPLVAQAAPAPSPSAGSSGRLGVFINGNYATGTLDRTSREAGVDFDSGGFTAGVDYRLTPNLILGAAFGYLRTSADYSQSGGSLDSDDYSGTLYGTYYVTDQFYLDGTATVGGTDYSIDRRIQYAVPGVPQTGGGITTVNQTARADTGAIWYAFGLSGGYDFQFSGFTVGPIGRLAYVRTEIDSYQEKIDSTTAGSGLALNVGSQTVESFTTSLGGQASYSFSTPFGVIVPTVRFEWIHEFLNDARSIKAHFVQDPTPSTGTTITWKSDQPDRDFFTIGAGLAATFPRGFSAFVLYETVVDLRDVTVHSVVGGVRMTF